MRPWAASTPFVSRSLAVLAVAALGRAFFVAFAPFWAGDSYEYDAIARNLLAGQGYALIAGSPTVFRPPGYPLFLAGVYAIAGMSPGMVLVAQVIVGAVSVWLVYLAARRLVGEATALAGALVAGLYPHMAFYAATILSETLALLFLASGMLAATHIPCGRRPLLSAGICGASLGLAALTAPRLAALPLVLLLVLAVQRLQPRRYLAASAALALAYASVLAPWMGRNAAVFGQPIPLTVGQGGLNLWLSASRVAPYDYRLDAMAVSEPLVARWLELYDGPGKSQERQRFGERLALEADLTNAAMVRIAADPAGYVLYRLRVLPGLWIQPAAYAGNLRPPFETQNDRLETMIAKGHWLSAALRVAAIAMFTVGLFVGLALGIWRWRHRLGAIALLLAPALYVLAVHSLLLAEQRYSVLSHPFLWVVAASGSGYVGSTLLSAWTKLRGSASR